MKLSTAFVLVLVLMTFSSVHCGKSKERKERWRNLREQIQTLNKNVDDFIEMALNASYLVDNQISAFKSSCGCQENPVCPDGWSQYQDHCYFFQVNLMNWQNAKDSCASNDSSLAQPDSAEEDQWLMSLTREHGLQSWLGASDIQQEGTWQSASDGNPLQYIHWADSREPNGGRTENCLLYKIRGDVISWNDGSCASVFASICEKVL